METRVILAVSILLCISSTTLGASIALPMSATASPKSTTARATAVLLATHVLFDLRHVRVFYDPCLTGTTQIYF